MEPRISVFLALYITASAYYMIFYYYCTFERKLQVMLSGSLPLFFNFIFQGALDVVAAVPTSTPATYSLTGPSQLAASNGMPGIDPVVREKLSRLFHIPPDFVHRLAAQTGYIDYEPTTAKPSPDYLLV